MMAGRSPLDDLLDEGRRQLDEMTGARSERPADEEPPAPARPAAVTGRVRGIPFRLNLGGRK